MVTTGNDAKTSYKAVAASTNLVSPLDNEGRHAPTVSSPAFLATLGMIPLWAVTVLPLSICYQLGKAVVKPILPKKQTPLLDSGYIVKPSEIVPRSERKYDVVVLGATGFTGRLAARHLAKTYGVGKEVKWAIAGRSKSKLNQVKEGLADELGMPEIVNVDSILVDTSIPSTLPNLVSQTRCVATTAGPYTLYGNSVVEFCAKFGTHYTDITGEIEWAKAMSLQWQETARKTGAKLVSFAGHDSIPWDLATMKMQNVLKDECNDNLKEVTFWDEMQGAAPGGTIATIFTFVEGSATKAPRVDVDPFRRKPDGSKSTYKATSDLPMFIAKSKSPWDGESSKRWTMPFVMAPVNAEIVKWSHAVRAEGSPMLVYRESAICNDFKTAFVQYVGMGMLGSMLFNPITGYVMKHYVLPKSGEGPSIESMEKKHFLCLSAEGIGEHGNRVQSHMYFPKDTGCLETSRMMAETALCLALEEDSHPAKFGGFWTPATGLGEPLLDRIVKTGTTFTCKVIQKPASRL